MEDHYGNLDKALFYFYNNSQQKTEHDEVYELIFEKKLITWVQVLDKLVKDGYLSADNTHINHVMYYISLEGQLFFERGGYSEEKRILRRKKMMTNITIIMQIANAVIIILIAIAAIYFDYNKS